MDWAPLASLVQSGGPVVIALAVLCLMIFLGFRFVITPYQKRALTIAKSQEEQSRQNALAAEAHENAAKSNAATSDANSRTAAHLERITEMLLEAALKAH